jgi:hypothetical protein
VCRLRLPERTGFGSCEFRLFQTFDQAMSTAQLAILAVDSMQVGLAYAMSHLDQFLAG